MNEPIISPWIIYVISRLDVIKGLCFAIILLSAIVAIPAMAAFMESRASGEDLEKQYEGVLRKAVCLLIVNTLLMVFIPSQEEAVAMYVASKVTPQVVQQTGESIDKLVDKFVDKIIKIKEAE